jgi:hypothetical protein
MAFRLIGAGVVLGGAGLLVIVNMVDRSMNYQTVQARVDAMTSTCFLEKRGYKSREWTDSRPCDEIEARKASDPQYASFHIKRETEAEVTYISPVDGVEHQGKLNQTTTDNEAPFKGASEGGLVPILAHTGDANKIQRL